MLLKHAASNDSLDIFYYLSFICAVKALFISLDEDISLKTQFFIELYIQALFPYLLSVEITYPSKTTTEYLDWKKQVVRNQC